MIALSGELGKGVYGGACCGEEACRHDERVPERTEAPGGNRGLRSALLGLEARHVFDIHVPSHAVPLLVIGMGGRFP